MGLRKLLKKTFQALSGVGVLMTIDSYWHSPDKAHFKELLKQRDDLINEFHKHEVNSVQSEVLKVKIESLKSQLAQEQSSVLTEVAKLKKLDPNSTNVKTDFKYHLDQFVSEAEKSNKNIQELIDIINKKNNFIPSNFPSDLIASWYEMLSHLSTAQLGALTHLFSSVFILTCLFTIISVVYGDFLLDYLKLEIRFPKLARFIKLRKTFKHFYLFINFMLIIITLLALIVVNTKILFYA